MSKKIMLLEYYNLYRFFKRKFLKDGKITSKRKMIKYRCDFLVTRDANWGKI